MFFLDEEKANMKKLHSNFSVILRVISSKSDEIDTEMFEDFCISTYLLIAQSFPWASIPQSIHRILAHSAERIRINDNFGLGSLSEEGLEATHKLIRRFRYLLARKTSLSENLRDVFKHLWTRSDPIVRSFARTLHCSKCNSPGHSKRSCSILQEGCSNEIAFQVEQFFVAKKR